MIYMCTLGFGPFGKLVRRVLTDHAHGIICSTAEVQTLQDLIEMQDREVMQPLQTVPFMWEFSKIKRCLTLGPLS